MDKHTWTGDLTEEEVERMTEIMKLFIFPNEAETDAQQEAFDKAVEYQLIHEKSLAETLGQIPDGASSFRIGDFSMTFGDGVNSSGLTRKTICPAAYSLLLRNGLLGRAVLTWH